MGIFCQVFMIYIFFIFPDAASIKYKSVCGAPMRALILILRKCRQDPRRFCSVHNRAQKN